MAQKFKIIKITVISGTGVRDFEVGKSEITRIEDVSNEYESSIEYMYQIWVNNNIKFNLVNCPVVIEYDDTV